MIYIRIIGAVLVLASCGVLGYYYSMKDSWRIRGLSEMKKALLLLEGEIVYAHNPLADALAKTAAKASSPVRNFFIIVERSINLGFKASEAWRDAANMLAAHEFSVEDVENTARLAESIGYLDPKTQSAGITMLVGYIDAQIEQLRQSEGKTKRLYRSAGVIMGLLIVTILI
ncbi:MAG: stage III sporulation protein AB [Defluviitaleaceae bacterium]|nr:stage III sporulation protein AB [Defluviitaleaceae bacterium]